jgi:protein involved in polysaccharide export with SLBB domain
LHNVFHLIRRIAEFGTRRTRVRNLMFTIGLATLVSGVIVVQRGRAQATDQNCSSDANSPDACAPNGEAQTPSSGDNSQGTEKNCNSDEASTGACAPNGEAGEAQAPSGGGNGAQEPGQSCGAEGSPEACGPNGQAETPTTSEAQEPNSTGNGAAQENGGAETRYGTDEEKCIQACAQSSDAESCLRSCAQSSKAKAAAGNGNGQAPSPNNSRQPRGAHVTPAGPRSQRPQSEPQEIQEPSPYKNLPSLYDLYTQIPAAGGKLQRFGSNAFIVGTGNANELPMDLPAGPDYVLGPGDGLIVNIWGGQSSRLNRTIDRQGQIELPEAGTIMISGMTIAEAQTAIQQALSAQFHDEHVEISLGRLRTVRVYVVGDVQRPGAYDVSSLSTALSALYAAGGPTSRGSLRILRQYRGDRLVREIDLYDFLLKGVRSDVERLQPGDTLLVPTVGPQVTVEGMVHRPAIYELNGEKTLNQVIDLAGGVLRTASLKQINVARIVAQERRTMVSLQLPDDPAEVAKKLADFPVQGGDDVVISQILPYNQDAVYLEGHVYRPGKYTYKDGMTITDLLHSYQDVMPEPSDHAELVRLQPPDFRPEIINFNLHNALIGNDSFPLEPFDLIHVYGRYEIDPPMVSIKGEVLRPGKYPMSEGMTAAGLVSMAGGFTRSAYRDEAGLSSYVVQNGKRVLVTQSIIAIGKALDGDKSADVPLSPGDVVSIQQLAGWQDIGSSVTIEGEVEHAGSYPIQTGERLSSVLMRAGGFRADAYPPAAVLERAQVRLLAEQARMQMIRQIEDTPAQVKQGAIGAQTATNIQQSVDAQRQEILTSLRSHPASGRLIIDISSDVRQWANTPDDIELRAGDTLFIPKRPNFVVVSGQVYNPAAISYVPGRDLNWYLRKGGGATPNGDKKQIYVLHADGSVVPRNSSWISNNFMDLRMRPGDTIFVPEKVIGASTVWQNIAAVAQAMSVAALPLAISGSF